MVLDSDLTAIRGDELFYRGLSATELAASLSFERAVELFWQTEVPGPFSTTEELSAQVLRAAESLGTSSHLIDRAAMTVLVAGSQDPMRYELDRDSVQRTGRQLIAAMIDALPLTGTAVPDSSPLAARLWARLSPAAATAPDLALIDAALVLCLDHDLAASTMAARVAASARANPYACVSAALGAFDSGLHGSVSISAAELIEQTIQSGEPERALSRQIARGFGIPGFGHALYATADPRAAFLFARMRALPRYRGVVAAADLLATVVRSRTSRAPNLDLALAALALGAGMSHESGQLLFAVGRTAGWFAHIVDEYTRPALRMRAESRYTGPDPITGTG
jgi:citrate synthase